MRAITAIAVLGLAAVAWRAGVLAAVTASAPVPAQAAAASTAQAGHAARPQVVAAPAMPPAPASLAKVEAAVREARRSGKGEQEVHRLRASQLPAAQVEELARMEAAESAWQQRLEALKAACAANLGCDDARASFTPAELQRVTAYAAPTLRH